MNVKHFSATKVVEKKRAPEPTPTTSRKKAKKMVPEVEVEEEEEEESAWCPLFDDVWVDRDTQAIQNIRLLIVDDSSLDHVDPSFLDSNSTVEFALLLSSDSTLFTVPNFTN